MKVTLPSVNTFPTVYETRTFITVLITARQVRGFSFHLVRY
jgi:hypothetical protein